MEKAKIKTFKSDSEKFTVKTIIELLTRKVGEDNEVDAAFVVVKTKEDSMVIPMGDRLELIKLLSSGMIEKAVKKTNELIGAEKIKRLIKAAKEEEENKNRRVN